MYDPERGYPRIVPHLLYEDPNAAIDWLVDVLGLTEVIRYTMPDGKVGHSELECGGFIVGIGVKGMAFGSVQSHTLVYVGDVDATAAKAVAAGGALLMEPGDRPWGLRQALIADPEGQHWEITQHVRDAPADEWGATQLAPMPG
jgi:uncharacterized glyoxalase superfamily protein PhnB